MTPRERTLWLCINAATGIVLAGISRHDLRPDIYGPAPKASAA